MRSNVELSMPILAVNQPDALRHAATAPDRLRLADEAIACAVDRSDPFLEVLAGTLRATVSGELDPLSTGVVYCELVCALQGAAQYDVADQWTEDWFNERGLYRFCGTVSLPEGCVTMSRRPSVSRVRKPHAPIERGMGNGPATARRP